MATKEELDSFDVSLAESISDESLEFDFDSDKDSEKYELNIKRNHELIDGRLVYDFEHHSHIPDSIYSYESVRELILDYNELSLIPEEFCERLSQLRVLSLLGNKLIELPSNIHLLECLEELYVDENQLTYLPDMLCRLTQLKKFHFQGNRLRSLPDGIHNLKQLKHLSLNENKLQSLPQTFGSLESLIELDLSYNRISSLPQNFGSLSQLRVLNISHNTLSSLPSSFADLQNLEVVELSSNSLTFLTDTFASDKRLKKLFLDDNQIYSLPKWVGDMEMIEEISLKCNCLRGSQFPESFGHLSKRLVKFDISGNLMEELPESFAQITTLQFIDTGSPLFEPERRKNLRNGNNIRHLPKSFGLNYVNMKVLRLDENDIEELPDCFGEGMPHLEMIDLYCNMIQYLPDSFCKLQSLRTLSIGMNCLKKLPKHFGNLIALEELRMEFNELKCLPPTFDQLVNLRVLDIYKNKFEAFPSILKNLENIKSLQVGLQISEMVIKISASQLFQIERLQNAINFGIVSKRKQTFSLSESYKSPTSHTSPIHQIESMNTSLQSSGYCSLQTSQDKVDNEVQHSLEESWDADVFDPQLPYLNEPLNYPNSHRIPTPFSDLKNFVPLKLHPPRIRTKRKKLSPVKGQFEFDL